MENERACESNFGWLCKCVAHGGNRYFREFNLFSVALLIRQVPQHRGCSARGIVVAVFA